MPESPEPEEGRKPYVKPEVVRVPLRPEEAILGSCKTSGGSTSGVGGSDCVTASCQDLGS